MKRPRLRAPVVVTLAAVAEVACSKEPTRTQNPPPPTATEHRNPPEQLPPPSATASSKPPPEVATTPPVASSAPPKNDPVRMSDFKRQLNESQKGRGTIHVSEKGCFVWGDWPDGKPRAPGMMPPPIDVPCPASMKDAAWKECLGGTVSTNDAGDACVCFVGGNPPPPPRRVSCPASAKPK